MKKKTRRWTGLQAILVAILIMIITWFYLTNIPSINHIKLFSSTADTFWNIPVEISLPFPVSRVFDLLAIIVFFYWIKGALKYLNKPRNRSGEVIGGSMLGIIFGLIIGAWLAINGAINQDIKLTFCLGLILVSLISLSSTIKDSIDFGLKFCLTIAITTGLMAGILISLRNGSLIGLSSSLLITVFIIIIGGLPAIFIWVLKYPFIKKLWNGLINMRNGISFND